MRYSCKQLIAAAALALGLLVHSPAQAQTVTYPAWMLESGVIINPAGNPPQTAPLFNRYLSLWQYYTGSELGRWVLWTNAGNPLDTADDFGYAYTIDTNGNITIANPWGPALFSQRQTAGGSTLIVARPFGNLTTVRFDDPANPSQFIDEEMGGGNSNQFRGRAVLPQDQGYFQGFVHSNNIQITQKTQFARDLLRIEYEVFNAGTTARQVGIRCMLNPTDGNWGINFPLEPISLFLPRTRERIFFETDYGRAVGTGTQPNGQPNPVQNPTMPPEWNFFNDGDERPDPTFITKGILTGNGATTPSRFAVVNVNSVNPATWDYAVTTPQELRLSDIGVLIYWEPVTVPAQGRVRFVTYAGVGVASHGMSNAYQAWQARSDISPGERNFTQGYIGAVQAPFALPLVNGDVDTQTFDINAFIQNEYQNSSLPNAFAFLDLPDALRLADSSQSQRLDLGSLPALGTGLDEGQGAWRVVATGIDPGQVEISVTFSNGFQDATRVTRLINVPQGRLYQLGDDWRMVTFPYTYSSLQNDPSQALGLAPGSFQIVKFNPLIGQYEQVTQVQPGESYWVRTLGLGETFVRLQNASPVRLNSRETFTSRLVTGWNQVGNPSPYAVPVREIRFLTTGGQHITLEQAQTQKLIGPGLWTYNRKTRQYEQLTSEDIVQPGKGIWIFSFSERTIIWPAPQGPALSITP